MPKPLPIVWHLDTNDITKSTERKPPDRLSEIADVMVSFETGAITDIKVIKKKIEDICKKDPK